MEERRGGEEGRRGFAFVYVYGITPIGIQGSYIRTSKGSLQAA